MKAWAAPGRRARPLLAAAAGLALLALAWDWDWFRGPVVNHLADRSGREVRVGHLDIDWHGGLDPTVRLQDLHVANAPWARGTAGKPFATAREASFTFAWRSLLTGRPVVTRLKLTGADIALERRADGLRNWRLRQPDDRGPGKFTFMRLEPHDSRLHVVNHAAGLDLRTASDDLPAEVAMASGPPLVQRITFEGRYRGAPFDGVATASRTLSFLRSGEAFSVRGAARSGAARLEVDGQVADLFRLGQVAAELRLSGPSLTALRPLLPADWPASAAFTASARLDKSADQWVFTDLQARLGRSDLAGRLAYRADGERPSVDARLSGAQWRLADLGLAGPGQGEGAPAPTARRPATEAGGRAAPSQRGQGLRRIDGRATLAVDALVLPGLPPLDRARTDARLDAGHLSLAGLRFGLAQGQVEGELAWDARADRPEGRVDLRWRGVQLAELLPPLPDKGRVNGPVSGALKLTTRGSDLASLTANASGQAHAELRDGSVSPALEARLALNGGQLLRAQVGDPPDVAIACARVELMLRDGRADVFPLQLDTTRTRVHGRGQLDLRERRIDLLLTPEPKQRAVLALKQSIRVKGPWADVDVGLEPAEPIRAAPGCPVR